MLLTNTVAVLIGYLFGSISSAIIVCRLMGLPDPRESGSNNPGATNVLRVGGKKAAIITLLGDLLKGFIPVLCAKWLELNGLGVALVASAAFLGHLFPVFFRFEGGKGVATLLGVLLALSWPAALSWLFTWILMAVLFRYSSLSSLSASILSPLYTWLFTKNPYYLLALIFMVILLVFRHRTNIKKLWQSQESKLNF